ncbi:purine-binding chemotaxis protein CheW [Pelosinus fermentans]|uniref:chemotaxis protein CheW n=1 Tax=Pelosinus fermentans TaxID=365349 RepID=UPI000268457C|nr:chemotaxis protein CheW [Pelosinus fermentans]OAM96222.1 CheW protein [Pelosinus fermentans DSM 17108]SDR37709.1 purine-binding chemotaxis protein CheW [Pelosinus fermentans]
MARVQMVVFEINGTEFAIEAAIVHGIIRTNRVTIQEVPGTLGNMEGMINWREKVRYVFNLRKKLKLENQVINDETKIMMVQTNERIVGCLVDEVTDIVVFNSEEIEAAPSFIQDAESKFIIGIGKVEERLVVMLDMDHLLTGAEINGLALENLQNYVPA